MDRISWPTVVEGDLKSHFSIATEPKFTSGRYFFPSIALLIFDMYLIIVNGKQADIKYRLLFSMTRFGIQRQSPGLYADTLTLIPMGGCPRGVMVKAMDCRIVVSEFVLQSRYYVHFRENTLGKDMSPLILPAMG